MVCKNLVVVVEVEESSHWKDAWPEMPANQYVAVLNLDVVEKGAYCLVLWEAIFYAK